SRHLPFVNSNTSRLAPGMYELAPPGLLHRVEPPLDALERLLHPVVAVPRLGLPLWIKKEVSHAKKRMCKNSDC
nr:hypothetical protein [Chloroflexota bacterium]